jgi:hypothetical protein
MLLNRTLYAATVAMWAFSPVLSIALSDFLGLKFSELDGWEFIWVGPALSLPLSLLVARAFGSRAYFDYWAYLESYPGNTKARILTAWGAVTIFTLVIGVAAMYARMDGRQTLLT